ncbi:hypothetical protein EN828_09685 [Mesorhizobium sp. M2D.F.Ca.ET.185.01.1.1]|uniref:DUF6894 family protein n=1 Tax=unclassified Mesorhizobium TaxID=325217 RepID=UPI000FCAFEDA|nr:MULTISPECIES: hypothetical protein [unclassified Mesorhizobium]TGP82844.1 hypothetical protein EN870_06280 [bacterium M00.F.Ca.ET.227.01.1.1]TGP94586.1 hypothetical protein EN864_14200 [bacterium M00.F.Ca.ET.221.01.1.1]TGP98040.1 hypothetical protein EN865_10425 [bacterium M00.F.Ca.ET.222.01.1.1]TGT74848.1 hypothetical protein EN802_07440 [bacterium M00.F.Ca.ET.159.01.1.1]TGT87716.1 hypothetical protein EN800_04330 [bacterium M00.F.Ca.ET.157.01.1.1]TGU02142.1 hypothetical protein EN806_455
MQVLDTTIHANPKGVTVDFVGEGGENIAVTMVVSDPLLGDAALVDRAREMMLQCAAFGYPAEGDRPDGKVDAGRPGTERPTDTSQGPYTFEYREDGSVRRLEGVELPDLEAVRHEALRSAIDLLDDAAESRQDGWAVRVRGSDGSVVVSVDFEEARQERATAAM